ncbi:MAG: hypothetical protein WC373_17585, partial [Smithella sp.]
MGTAAKQVLSLQRHLDNLKVAFGLAFTPALATMIEAVTGAVTGLNGELSGESRGAITAWGKEFAGSISAMLSVIKAISSPVTETIKIIWELKDAIIALGLTFAAFKLGMFLTTVGSIIPAITAVITALAAAKIAVLGFLWSLGPVGLVIAALSAIIGASYYAYKKFTGGAEDAKTALVEFQQKADDMDLAHIESELENVRIKLENIKTINSGFVFNPFGFSGDKLDSETLTNQERYLADKREVLKTEQYLADVRKNQAVINAAREAKEAKAAAAAKKATEEFKKTAEEAKKINEALGNNIKLNGLDDLDKKLMEIQIKYEKLAENPLVDKGKLKTSKEGEIATAQSEANQKIIDSNKKMYDEMEQGGEKYADTIKGLQTSIAGYYGDTTAAILAEEERKYQEINRMMDAGYISFEKAENAWVLLAEETALKLMEADAKKLEAKAAYYKGIDGMEEKAHKAELAAIEIRRIMGIKAYGDVGAANAKATQDAIKADESKIDATQKWTNTVLSNLGSMLDAAKECYSEDSYEYNRINEIKKGILMAQQAMEVAKNIQILMGIKTQTAAAVAGAGIQNAANASTAVTGAVASVTSAGSGDPYTGFARVAAMIAIMASVLSIIGISFSGGSSSGGAASSAHLQKSTVLGAEDGTGSESLSNSLEILKDTYDIENTRLTQIYNEMRELNDNITGLITNLIRSGGISIASGLTLGDLGGAVGDSGLAQTIGGLWGSNLTDTLANFGNNKLLNITGKVFDSYKYFDPLAGSISLFPKLLSSMFGGDVTVKLKESGISFGETIVSELLAGADAAARQYAKVKITEEGGWFGSDSTKTKWYYDSLDASVTRMITLVYNNISSGLIYMAQELGGDVADV